MLTSWRGQAGAIRAFCGYLTEPLCGWPSFCEKVFNDVPAQIVLDWNSPRHTTDDAVPPRRRSLTIDEMEALFNAADDIVDEEYAAASKGWLTALRDSIAIKVGYAYALRRRELTMLEYVDFGPNPHVPAYGGFGALQVRWAKGTKGSGPRRRTVLTVPYFEWVVDLLTGWLSPSGRELFATADRSAAITRAEDVCRSTGLDQATVDELLRTGHLEGAMVGAKGSTRVVAILDDKLPSREALAALGLPVRDDYDPDALRSYELIDDDPYDP